MYMECATECMNVLFFISKVIAEKVNHQKSQELHQRDAVSGNGPCKGKVRRAFLDMLLNATDDGGNKLSYLDVREEVDTFMFEV